MIRVLAALVIGAIVAAGIMYLLALIIGGDWVSPSSESKPEARLSPNASLVQSEPLATCDAKIEAFQNAIASANFCEANSDCSIARFGCPFGCYSAVNKAELPSLKRKADGLKNCQSCIYMCPSIGTGGKAVCVFNQCLLRKGSIFDEEIEAPDRALFEDDHVDVT